MTESDLPGHKEKHLKDHKEQKVGREVLTLIVNFKVVVGRNLSFRTSLLQLYFSDIPELQEDLDNRLVHFADATRRFYSVSYKLEYYGDEVKHDFQLERHDESSSEMLKLIATSKGKHISAGVAGYTKIFLDPSNEPVQIDETQEALKIGREMLVDLQQNNI